MAIFNPQIPDLNAPEYLSRSRAITPMDEIKRTGQRSNTISPTAAVYEGPKYEGMKGIDQSGEYIARAGAYTGKAYEYAGQAEEYKGKAQGLAAKGLGDLIAGGIQIADLASKEAVAVTANHIKESEISKFEDKQDEYIKQLEEVSGNTRGSDTSGSAFNQTTPGSDEPGMDQTAIPDNASYTEGKMDVIPQEKKEPIPQELEKLGQRAANLVAARNKGLSATLYTSELYKMAKDLRSRYPGFRDFIDAEISKATGIKPANAYIKSMIADINSYMSASNAQRNKDSAIAYDGFKKGWISPEQLDAFNKGTMSTTDMYSAYYKEAKREADRKVAAEERKDWTEDRVVQEKKATDQLLTQGTQIADKHMNDIMFAINADKPEKVSKILDDLQSGRVTLNDQQWQALADRIGLGMQAARSEIQRTAIAGGSTSLATKAGSDYTKTIDASLAGMEAVRSAILKQDGGMAFAMANANKHIADNTEHAVRTGPGGNFFNLTATVAKIFPNMNEDLFVSVLKGQKEYGDATTRLTQLLSAGALQDNPNRPATWARDLQTLQNEGRAGQGTGKAGAAAVEKTLSVPLTVITNPKQPDEAKANFFKYLTNPGNAGVIRDQFQDDYRDPQTNRVVPGRYSVFGRLTAPSIAEEAARLGKDNPEVTRNYTNFIGGEFGRLFQENIQNMNSTTIFQGGTWSWNTINHEFKFNPNKNVMNNQYAASVAEDNIRKLNWGIHGVVNTLKAQGMKENDIDAQIYSLIQSYGMVPGRANTPNVTIQLGDALRASYARQRVQGETEGGKTVFEK